MEKTFIDWYLLGCDESADNEFVQKILSFIEYDEEIDDLNILEKCLMIEVCI